MMDASKNLLLNEDIFASMDPLTFRTIKIKGAQMDAEIAAKMEKLKGVIMEGFSHDSVVKARVNGTHQVVEISFDPTYSLGANDKTKTCALIAEAINEAICSVDLTIETEISLIKYKYTSDIINLGH